MDRRTPTSAAVWGALGTVYVVWGSTYLAIRVAIETMPPLLMASVRFLIAGALLYGLSVRRGDRVGDRPTRQQWVAATVIGTLLLGGGNGLVAYAEQRVPSGTAALLVACTPLWMALLDRAVFGVRLRRITVAGLILGFSGVAVLVRPEGSSAQLFSLLAVVLASLSWATGSLYARRAPLPARPMVGAGMEMLAGGVVLGLVGLAGGELGRVDAGRISLASALSLAYLIVFGALAFSCYIWVLRAAPTTLVSTYAFVNPVVAVLLGWAFQNEAVTGRTLVAAAVIVAGVAAIVTSQARASSRPAPVAPGGEPGTGGVTIPVGVAVEA